MYYFILKLYLGIRLNCFAHLKGYVNERWLYSLVISNILISRSIKILNNVTVDKCRCLQGDPMWKYIVGNRRTIWLLYLWVLLSYFSSAMHQGKHISYIDKYLSCCIARVTSPNYFLICRVQISKYYKHTLP